MKTDQNEDSGGLALWRASRHFCLLLVVLTVASGCATRPVATTAATPEQAQWINTFTRWYPGWENEELRHSSTSVTEEESRWAYQIKRWYPAWQPGAASAPAVSHSWTEPLPDPHTVPGGKPVPPEQMPRIVPMRTTSPAQQEQERQLANPRVSPEGADDSRAPAALVPADTDEFRIVPDRGAAPVEPPKRYTIQRGDTLSSIAEKFYGDASAWRRIRDANQHLITNPNNLTVGVTIRIP